MCLCCLLIHFRPITRSLKLGWQNFQCKSIFSGGGGEGGRAKQKTELGTSSI